MDERISPKPSYQDSYEARSPQKDESEILKSPSVIKPTVYTPGRLNNVEILQRVFPLHRKSVLELVLQGCNGDLVKAIEQFLSAQDTIEAQNKTDTNKPDVKYHPYGNTGHWSSRVNSQYSSFLSTPFDSKSAFKPLSGIPTFSGLHSAFLPGYSSLTSTPSLNTPLLCGQYSTSGLGFPHGVYPGLSGYGGSVNPLLNSSFSLFPYRSSISGTQTSKSDDRDTEVEKK